MHQTIKDTLHPAKKTGGYFAPHAILLAAIVVAVLALAGVFAVKYDSRYFRTHFPHPGLKVPTAQIRVSLPPRAAYPASASIDMTHLPAAQSQSTLGACAAFASALVIDYEYRTEHPRHPGIRFSPRAIYSRYSETYSNGQDEGSWPDQLVAPLPTLGIPQWRQFSYPPYVVDPSIPADVQTLALRHKLHVHANDLVINGTGGQIVDALKSVITQGRPAVLAVQVPQSFDNATQAGGLVYGPAGQPSRGGHAIVALAYSDSMRFPDGSLGGVEIQNQWTRQWGVNGRAWISYDWLGKYGIGVVDLTLDASPMVRPVPIHPHVGKKHHWFANNGPLPTVPPSVGNAPPAPVKGTAWYVHNVRVHYESGASFDISSYVNSEGDKYGVSPIFIAAVMGTESGMTINVQRWAGGLDNSCGLMQQILANVAALTGNSDPVWDCQWEMNPFNSVDFGARILRDDIAQHGGRVPPPWAYGMYNCGPGLPDSAYFNPSGQCYQNYEFNFLPNWRYAWSYYATYQRPIPPKPAPKPVPPFRIKRWNAFRWHHHKRLISPWYCQSVSNVRPGQMMDNIVHGALAHAILRGQVSLIHTGSVVTSHRNNPLLIQPRAPRAASTSTPLWVGSKHVSALVFAPWMGNLASTTLDMHVPHIILSRAQEQMIRSNAWRVIAVMQNPQASRNRSVRKLPREAMSGHPTLRRNGKRAIAEPKAGTLPRPATRTALYLIPKALLYRLGGDNSARSRVSVHTAHCSKLDWAASIWRYHQSLGGVKSAHWYHPRGEHGYTITRFKHGEIATHPFCHCANVTRR